LRQNINNNSGLALLESAKLFGRFFCSQFFNYQKDSLTGLAPHLKAILKKTPLFGWSFSSEGFSLVEILVVTTIIVILSTLMVFNFRSSSTNTTSRHQVASVIVADIRELQARALAGISATGTIVCGYGIHFVNSQSYLTFTRQPDPVLCSKTDDRKFGAGNDQVLDTKIVGNPNFAIQTTSGWDNSDIYFEPPDPTTYINNEKTVAGNIEPSETILIVRSNDPSDLSSSTITVYASGKIDITDSQ